MIYFIATVPDGDIVKVGRTDRSSAERCQELIRHSPKGTQLEVIAEMEGGQEVEAWWHRLFRDMQDIDSAKIRKLPNPSEWFRLEGDVLETVLLIRDGATGKELCPGPFQTDGYVLLPDRAVKAPDPSERPTIVPTGKKQLPEQLSEVAFAEQLATLPLSKIDAELARRDFSEFVRQAWHVVEPGVELEWNWHHQALCDNLQAFLEGWITTHRKNVPLFVQNTAWNVPPATLKSKIIMVLALPWMWLHEPTFKMAALSSNPTNVKRDSDACRDLVMSKWYRDSFNVGWEIRSDIDSKEKYRTTAGGERVSRGMAANPVGLHVDWIAVDDPDATDTVFSDAIRTATHESWDALSNRVQHAGKSIRSVVLF